MEHYYRRSPDVASRIVDGEAVLVKTPGNEVFVLNYSAARMWVEMDGTRTGAELAQDLDARAVEAFLGEMSELGIVLRGTSPVESPETFPQAVDWPESTGEPPRVRASESLEVLAGICGSDYGGESDCRTEGFCLIQWD